MRKLSPTTLAAAVSIALLAQGAFAQTRGAVPSARTNAAPNAAAPNATAPAALGPARAGQTSNTVTFVSTDRGLVAIGTPVAGNGNGSTSSAVTSLPVTNLQGAQLVDANGRVLTDANGQPFSLDARGVVGIAPLGVDVDSGVAPGTGNTQVVILNPNDLAGSVVSTPELDQATRKELDKAKAASRSRNKQLLYTIAPRTNADRTDQMADDPPSPAISIPERRMPGY